MSAPHKRHGFILGYLLFALAILSLVVISTGQMLSKQDNAKWIASAKDRLEDQGNLIFSQLSLCAVLNTSETDTGMAQLYPSGADVNVSDLVCPSTLANIWDGSSGGYAPPVVSGFSQWKYFSSVGAASPTVYFYVTAGDAHGKVVLNGVLKRLGASQATLSQTVSSSDTLKLYVLKPE